MLLFISEQENAQYNQRNVGGYRFECFNQYRGRHHQHKNQQADQSCYVEHYQNTDSVKYNKGDPEQDFRNTGEPDKQQCIFFCQANAATHDHFQRWKLHQFGEQSIVNPTTADGVSS